MHLPVIPVLRPHIKGDDTSSSCLFFIICALMNFCCYSTITAIWRWKDATVLLRLLSQNRVCLQTFHTNKKRRHLLFIAYFWCFAGVGGGESQSAQLERHKYRHFCHRGHLSQRGHFGLHHDPWRGGTKGFGFKIWYWAYFRPTV